jgi:peroxiredoxin
VVVVDVWEGTCPVCHTAAPGLVQTQRKYKDRGVTFVSLTANPRSDAETFVRAYGITWPCQFATPDETLAALGTLGRKGNSGTVFSTLYVVRADRTIAWSDRQARMRHEDTEALIRELQQALDDALRGG